MRSLENSMSGRRNSMGTGSEEGAGSVCMKKRPSCWNMGRQRGSSWRKAENSQGPDPWGLMTQDTQNSSDESGHIVIITAAIGSFLQLSQLFSALRKSGQILFDFA